LLQIKAEKIKMAAVKQEAAASKMREENKVIREVETDLSTFIPAEYSKSFIARIADFKLSYLMQRCAYIYSVAVEIQIYV